MRTLRLLVMRLSIAVRADDRITAYFSISSWLETKTAATALTVGMHYAIGTERIGSVFLKVFRRNFERAVTAITFDLCDTHIPLVEATLS